MKAADIERAAYIAAHAILTADLNAPELACSGARRSYAVDAIAEVIKGVFALDRSDSNPSLAWRKGQRAATVPDRWPSKRQKILHAHADTAARLA
jgi:hypothetical protein